MQVVRRHREILLTFGIEIEPMILLNVLALAELVCALAGALRPSPESEQFFLMPSHG